MKHMFGPPAAPTDDGRTEDTPVEDTSDNVSSTPIQQPIIQEFVLPTLNQKKKGNAKTRALIDTELADRNSNQKAL